MTAPAFNLEQTIGRSELRTAQEHLSEGMAIIVEAEPSGDALEELKPWINALNRRVRDAHLDFITASIGEGDEREIC